MHYLDYAATTPLLPAARDEMLRFMAGDFGNPSSVHAYGRSARSSVEDARERVALAIGASPGEVTFTAGGTEADNLALQGAAAKRRGSGDHIVVTAFEHHAVLDTALHLEKRGFKVSIVAVNETGVVAPSAVAAAVRPQTILVSVMAVNNEIGTVQPIAEIVRAVKSENGNTLVHTDAVQALGNIPVDVAEWGVDLASFSAHKLGGPKGTGALFVRSHVPVEALLHGGGQERGLRSGTLNVAGIVGFGIAAETAAKEVHDKAARLSILRARLWDEIQERIQGAVLNGDAEARVAGNLNVSFVGAEGETMLLLLDQSGIACSTGSACQSGAVDPSHVLLAIGTGKRRAAGSLRFSLGRDSTEEDVDAVVAVLPEIVERARSVA